MTDNKDSIIRRVGLSFKYAIDGLVYVFRTQRNARIHGVITLAVIALGLWLQVSGVDWAILVLAMMVVWVAEFFNTALEVHVDFTTPEQREPAKIAKDSAAAAVLIGAVGAVIVGLSILGPPLVEKVF
ncbi:MAG TPA: diacylglycerol kinase family protein [candidate division Zixibacteria bacterium]|nr:diacylglycerol kinase family protein [candidate division Zixibacteria bacterium]